MKQGDLVKLKSSKTIGIAISPDEVVVLESDTYDPYALIIISTSDYMLLDEPYEIQCPKFIPGQVLKNKSNLFLVMTDGRQVVLDGCYRGVLQNAHSKDTVYTEPVILENQSIFKPGHTVYSKMTGEEYTVVSLDIEFKLGPDKVAVLSEKGVVFVGSQEDFETE